MAEFFFRVDGLKDMQAQFEEQVRGTDKTLYDHNTPEFILARGVIGEAVEALEALSHGTLEDVKMEAIDIAIFLSSLFYHLGMSADEIEQVAKLKMSINFTKYNPANFEGRTLQEGIAFSRSSWKQQHSSFDTAFSNVLLSSYGNQTRQETETDRGSTGCA